MEYLALLRKEDGTAFGVEFPDFPGCITAGDTLEEAHRRAAEVLQFHIEGIQEDGEEIPAPSKLGDVVEGYDAVEGSVPFLVSVPGPKRKVVRVNVTFSEDILELVDQLSQVSWGGNRSAFLAEAARRMRQDLEKH